MVLIFVPLYFKNFDLLMKEKLFDLTFTTYNVDYEIFFQLILFHKVLHLFLLYQKQSNLRYKSILSFHFNVNRAFLIEKNSFTNLKTNKTYTYEEYYNNIYNKGNNDSLEIYMAEVYKENLQELKNTVF